MKAAVYYTTGGPEVFRYEDVPDPVPGPGEVLVRVEAISIEGGDTLNRPGGDIPRAPHIVGYQCAGIVVATGPGVEGLADGDRVVTVGLDGSHAELRAVGEAFCWVIPSGLDHRGGGVRPGAVRHRRRLPVRVRPSPGRGDGAHPGGGQRGGHRRHPAGQAGGRHRARHGIEPLPPRAAGPVGPRPRHRLHRRGLRRSRPPADRRSRGRRHRRLGRGDNPAEEPALPGLPGPVRLIRRRRP